MTALAQNIKPQRMGDQVVPVLHTTPVADSVHIFQGSTVVETGGYGQPATAALGLAVLGVSEEEADNTVSGHAAGAISCSVRAGVFQRPSAGGGDAIGVANIGQDCYLVDDNVVALTDGNGTRSKAGKIDWVDAAGNVWVQLGLVGTQSAPAYPKLVVAFSLPLVSITAATIFSMKPGFAGRIQSFQAVVDTAATTAAKGATVTPNITPSGGSITPVTGGGLVLTSANMTPVGNNVAAAAITGANVFGAADTIQLVGSAVTAFVEGHATLYLTLA